MARIDKAFQVNKIDFPPNSSAAARPTKAMVVLPMPPGPSSVTNRSFRSLLVTSLTTVFPHLWKVRTTPWYN
jgi:hypothetical protein